MNCKTLLFHFSVLIGLSCLFISCITKKKLVENAHRYQSEKETTLRQDNEHISVVLDIDSANETPVYAQTGRRLILPFILINFWEVRQDVVLPDEWFRESYSEYLMEFNDSINLHDALGGLDVNVILTNVPNHYYTQNKGWIVDLLIPVYYGHLAILTDDFALEAKIELSKNGTVVETLDYSYSSVLPYYHFRLLKHNFSKQKWSRDYLSQRDLKTKYLAYTMCDMLIHRDWKNQ